MRRIYNLMVCKGMAPKERPEPRGCSSVVERHVANVAVVGSSPITRFICGREGRENEDLLGLVRSRLSRLS